MIFKICKDCEPKRKQQIDNHFVGKKMFICDLCSLEVEGAMMDKLCNSCSLGNICDAVGKVLETTTLKCKCCMLELKK